MSQHHYAYGPPEGYYQQPNPNPSLPYPAYGAPSYHPSSSGAVPPYSNGNASNQEFDHNRNMIPGLGLGFPNPAPEWRQQWTNPSAVAVPVQNSDPGMVSQGPGAAGPIVDNLASASRPTEPGVQNDNMDEGELSEGELEDIYEPKYPDEDLVPAGNNGSRNHALPTNGAAAVAQDPVPQDGLEAELSALDRGGSYSPYLSSHEVEQSEPAKGQGLSLEGSQRPEADIAQPPMVKSLAQARKQAQDAIIRLWPLNVRYQDYLNEGIDSAVLRDLFHDLGLDCRAVSSRSTRMSEATPDSDMQLPKTANLESEGGPRETSGSAMGPTKQSDSNEERKDRIARLLAAKGTKQAAVPSETAVKPLSSLPTPSSVSAKALSEKSKLLRQKMEALQRSREAQLHGPGPESGPGHGNVGDTQNGTSTMLSETAVAPSLDQTQVPPQGGSTQSPPPIPGLFLSSTSTVKRPSSTSQQKRPAASDLNDTSDIPFKRPFGQSRQTQPFLIDVSDDEDDEAMDLDSPELKPASANRPSSPFKIPPFRDLHTAPTNHLDRQMSSPMPTPPSNYSGRGDLKSMNKEIEAMKKKIAEAEARKKAKLSRPTSPAMGQTDNPRRVGSAASSIPLTSAEDSGAEGGSPQPPAEPESRRLPKVSENRRDGQRGSSRSRSRAASERLPIIEAHRREQLMKLQALQTQVKRMEEEIEDSLLEEHRLREEAVAASNSGEDDTESPSSEPAPVQESPEPPPQVAGTSLPGDQEEPAPYTPDESSAHDETEGAICPNGDAVDVTAVEDPMTGTQEGHPQLGDCMEQEVAHLEESEYSPEMEGRDATKGGSESSTEDSGGHHEVEDEDASDGYEPPEAESSTSGEDSQCSFPDAAPAEDTPLVEVSDNEIQGVSATTPITQPISTGQQESKPPSPREAHDSTPADAPTASKSGFVPYETPLKYFRAYRFHPRFPDAVSGGLRSLTYSNKIDVKKELCPDQLAGTICPRGEQCDFQHFEAMEAPDDQILLQLGAYGNYEGQQKQEYINGLRQLLTDFRNRKIKDFKAISQGIIDYRAQFRKDPSKILPLGDVSI